jgi:hypothetical protein
MRHAQPTRNLSRADATLKRSAARMRRRSIALKLRRGRTRLALSNSALPEHVRSCVSRTSTLAPVVPPSAYYFAILFKCLRDNDGFGLEQAAAGKPHAEALRHAIAWFSWRHPTRYFRLSICLYRM